MRVSVVGTGHVGLVTAACLAHIGHEVLGVDQDSAKIASIAAGRVPFFEPGLQEMVDEGLSSGRLRVSTDIADAAHGRDVIFISVGTPSDADGEPDLSQVDSVARMVGAALDGYAVITEKSTVPIGTGMSVMGAIRAAAPAGVEFDVASNPEFLQEGKAIEGTLEPTRIVVGATSDRAVGVLQELYKPIVDATGCPFIATDIGTAELVKHASNAFLATKISFINKVAEICERTGADVGVVSAAMGLDPRIAPGFLQAGIGYGGACFPKDVAAFRYTAEQHGVDFALLEEVERVNTDQRHRFVEKIRSAVGDIEAKTIAVWGLAFKPDTDDLRHAPGLVIAERLLALKAVVSAYDPAAMEAAAGRLPHARMASDPIDAARGAHCVAVCTEWSEFSGVDLHALRDVMATPVMVDGRNAIDPTAAQEAGFLYLGTGRSMSVGPTEGEG